MKAVRISCVVIPLLLVVFCSTYANAYMLHGKTTLTWAKEVVKYDRGEKADAQDIMFFRGIATAYSDVAAHQNEGHFPLQVSSNQLASIFAKYLIDHPETLHLPAYEIYVASMKAAFPDLNP